MTRPSPSHAAAVLAAAALALLSAACDTTSSPPPSQVRPFVRGYIAVQVAPPNAAGQRRGHDVFIPRIEVHLLDLSDDSRGEPALTDLSGRFTLPAKAGRYRVCWRGDGFQEGCAEQIVSVLSEPVHVSTVRIPVEKRPDHATVWGSVTLSDGSGVRLLEPFADLNAFGRVVLLDEARAEGYEALVNNFGEYLLPAVPAGKRVFLAARAGAGEGLQEIRPQANLAGAAFHRVALTIPNAPPEVAPLVPRHGSGDPVHVAGPGETIELTAEAGDPDGDPVELRWLAGAGTLSATTGDTVSWTLPAAPGGYAVTLIASDGRGGWAREVLSVRADPRGVLFAGRVVATGTGAAIPGAEVEVNGEKTATDSIGGFYFHVPAARRYVLNVRHPGFALLSRIFDRGAIGGVYPLRRATVVTVDPTGDVEVVDRRSPRDCPGPPGLRFDAKTFPAGVRSVWQDGKGNVIAPRGEAPSLPGPGYRPQQECGPGVRVRIPANSLVDSGGNPPAGPVEVALSTVDLMSPDQMPGDYTVALPAGGTRVMESYGAATVEIRSGGAELNLAPGATAEVVIPVDPAQLAAGGALPPTIPILFYDETAGVWREEGSATLTGGEYVAKVKHFSAINTDLIKTNQACVRVDASDPGMPGSFRMQVIIPLGGGVAPRVLDVVIVNTVQKEHVVYNLPANTNITLAPYDAATGVPYGTFVVDTGGPQNPTDPNLPFGPPYLACSTLVELSPQVLPDDPLSGEFLHGLLSFNATELIEADIPDPGTLSGQLDQATTNYYAQVDPNGDRVTLDGPDGFKTVHGFGAGGPGCANLAAGETCAIFANSGDLGFGREMHCKTNGADVACYVTNYGDIFTPDSTDVDDAVDGVAKVATVAMEYAPIEGDPAATPVVKFFVYNGAGTRVNRADLDGKGLRPVPQLCMVCHGGAYPGGPTTGVPPFTTFDEVKLGSEFLAFDLHNYTFAAAPFDKASQQAAFKTLNEQIVLATNPASAHTTLYIAEMYDGDNGVPATDQEELLVIDDPGAAAADRWGGQPAKREMYRHVIGNACRTCHATHPVPALRFVNAPQVISILGQVETRVCVQHVMPHAKVTHDLFWLSADDPATPGLEPHQPGILQAFGDDFGNAGNGWVGNLCGVFTAGGVTPPSAFGDIQSDIFNLQCTSCHVGGAPPGNLNLQAGTAYGQLVGVASCGRPAMQRVQAGSANDSFLFRKLAGSHGGLGGCDVTACNPFAGETGCGFQMPWTGAVVSTNPLSAPELQQIEDWIDVGAPN